MHLTLALTLTLTFTPPLNLLYSILWQKPFEWNVDKCRAMHGSFLNTPVFGPEDKLMSWRR